MADLSPKVPSGPMACCLPTFPSFFSGGKTPAARKKTKAVAQDIKRTTNSVFRLRCSERPDLGNSVDIGVKLVVFDFDETLTLVTLMTPDGTLLPEQEEWAKNVNFESPWVDGSRIEKLNKMFTDLATGKDGESRSLAILTRNGNASGVSAVMNLLRAAGLDQHFSAIWILPRKPGRWNGAYREDNGKWHNFDPPSTFGQDHKAHVLQRIAANPEGWFPQMKLMSSGSSGLQLPHLQGLQSAEMVLVDDQRANFQSAAGAQVLRYVKVARYDANFREFGFMRDMGGIGAHDDADYESLKRFVEDPWMCKDTFQVRCQERTFEGNADRPPVTLVIFDFDETLTMATFMPDDPNFSSKIGAKLCDSQWCKDELIQYNFESPYVRGSRVQRLQELLKGIVGEGKTLAILTKNENGIVAVVNLLALAGLDQHFSAIWTIPPRDGKSSGAYKNGQGQWKTFDPPVKEVHTHKADVLHHVASNPQAWFPQMAEDEKHADHACDGLRDNFGIANIVLIDDERANFRSNHMNQARVLRYVKVARYDENYRDCGLLNQMGGLGARNEEDFEVIKNFIREPWNFPYESEVAARARLQTCSDEGRVGEETPAAGALVRDLEHFAEDTPHGPRIRRNTVHSTPSHFQERLREAGNKD